MPGAPTKARRGDQCRAGATNTRRGDECPPARMAGDADAPGGCRAARMAGRADRKRCSEPAARMAGRAVRSGRMVGWRRLMPQDAKTESRAAFDRQAPDYDRARYGQHARWLQPDVLAEVERLAPGSLVNVGCGTGAFLAALGEMRPGIELHGIDLSPQMLTVARRRLGERADLRVADAEALSLADGAVDAVVCIDSFHQYPNPRAALAEMRRVVRPGGWLVLADWRAPAPFRSLMNALLPHVPGGDVRIYSKEELCRLGVATGFDQLRWRRTGRRAQLLVGRRPAGHDQRAQRGGGR